MWPCRALPRVPILSVEQPISQRILSQPIPWFRLNEVVNPSISGDSPVSVESIFEKPIGSTTNLLSEEFLSVFAARSTKPDIDPDSVPAPELGGAFADTELNAYVEDLPSIRDILFSFSWFWSRSLFGWGWRIFPIRLSLCRASFFLPWLRRVTFVPIQLMRMLSLIPGLAESSFPCLWFTPRLSDKIYAVSRLPSLLQSRLLTIGNTRIRLSLSCPRSYFLSKLSLHSAIPTTGQA